jgi:hypothetical protein
MNSVNDNDYADPKANPLTDEQFAALVARFNGGPGLTEGLSHQETVDMLIHAEKNNLATQNGLTVWIEAYREGDLLPPI